MSSPAPPTTPLRRQLAGEAVERRPAALDAFLAARRKFLAGERVDMTSLAVELGVNRVTLYRWVGSREQLLVEVVWSLARRTLDDLVAAHPRGEGRVVKILMGFLEATLAHPGMQRWLAEEGESAMRVPRPHGTDRPAAPRAAAGGAAAPTPGDRLPAAAHRGGGGAAGPRRPRPPRARLRAGASDRVLPLPGPD